MRAGGEFEMDLSMLSRSCIEEYSPMPDHYKLWVDTGRSALLLALEEIIRQGGLKQALLPAYICPTVISPFIKLGFKLRFYNLNRLADIPTPESGETILFAHYFGKWNFSAIEWVKYLQAKSQFFVIEDCVQASLNTNVGETGDFVITSYRKFLPQPDGAILGTRREVNCNVLSEPDEAFVSAKIIGKLLRSFSDQDELFLKTLGDAEDRLELLRPRKMSWISSYLLKRTDVKRISHIRRANWLSFYEYLDQEGLLSHILPLHNSLDVGEVPLGFPVQIRNGQRDKLKQYLALNHIYCPVHWELDHLDKNDKKYIEEIALSRNILMFPIDQRLNKLHIENMVKIVANYFVQLKAK